MEITPEDKEAAQRILILGETHYLCCNAGEDELVEKLSQEAAEIIAVEREAGEERVRTEMLAELNRLKNTVKFIAAELKKVLNDAT